MKETLFTAVAALLIFLGATTLQSDAEIIVESDASTWSEAVGGLQCRLVAQKNEYTVGEPILVEVQLRNIAAGPVVVYQGYHTLVTTSFDIRDNKGDKVEYRGYISGVGLLYPTLLPGTNEHFDRTGYYTCGISFDLSQEYEISSPGTYKVSAIFHGPESGPVTPKFETNEIPVWTGQLNSNTIEIKVSPKDD